MNRLSRTGCISASLVLLAAGAAATPMRSPDAEGVALRAEATEAEQGERAESQAELSADGRELTHLEIYERRAEQDAAAHRRWYGHFILASDAAAAIGVGVGLVADSGAILGVSVVGLYLAGPFAVHALHDRPGAAFGSVGMRIGAPALGMLIGSSDCDGFECVDGVFVGAVVGALFAITFDVSLLAWKELDVKPAVRADESSMWLGVSMGF